MNAQNSHRLLPFGILLSAAAGPSSAHDFWIRPSTFYAAPASIVKVHLMVGSDFPGDPVARDPARIVTFASYGPTGEQPIAGRDGMDPAGLAKLQEPGVYTLVYRSNQASITIEPAKFETYLKEEGLEKIIDARAAAGQSSSEANERYSRCCKSLIRVGDGPMEGFDRTVGLTLELTALDNPCAAKPGDQIRFRVDHEGRPCEGLLVDARNAEHPGEVISARSASDGTVSFTLPDGGMWVIAAVQMFEAPKDSGADWESLWTSLSFEIAEPAATAETKP